MFDADKSHNKPEMDIFPLLKLPELPLAIILRDAIYPIPANSKIMFTCREMYRVSRKILLEDPDNRCRAINHAMYHGNFEQFKALVLDTTDVYANQHWESIIHSLGLIVENWFHQKNKEILHLILEPQNMLLTMLKTTLPYVDAAYSGEHMEILQTLGSMMDFMESHPVLSAYESKMLTEMYIRITKTAHTYYLSIPYIDWVMNRLQKRRMDIPLNETGESHSMSVPDDMLWFAIQSGNIPAVRHLLKFTCGDDTQINALHTLLVFNSTVSHEIKVEILEIFLDHPDLCSFTPTLRNVFSSIIDLKSPDGSTHPKALPLLHRMLKDERVIWNRVEAIPVFLNTLWSGNIQAIEYLLDTRNAFSISHVEMLSALRQPSNSGANFTAYIHCLTFYVSQLELVDMIASTAMYDNVAISGMLYCLRDLTLLNNLANGAVSGLHIWHQNNLRVILQDERVVLNEQSICILIQNIVMFYTSCIPLSTILHHVKPYTQYLEALKNKLEEHPLIICYNELCKINTKKRSSSKLFPLRNTKNKL